MISRNHKFKQIETGIIAFVADLEVKLQSVIPNLPVFIMHTGDSSYFLDKKFKEIKNQEIYQKIPRFVIGIEDIQIQTDQYSNKFNIFNYQLEGITYQASGRRIPLQIIIQTDFVSSNFIKALENWEVATNIFAGANVYSYEFLGNTFEAAYLLASPSIEKPTMDANSSTRNYSVKLQLELLLSPMYPKLKTIKKLADIGFESIHYDMNDTSMIKDETDTELASET